MGGGAVGSDLDFEALALLRGCRRLAGRIGLERGKTREDLEAGTFFFLFVCSTPGEGLSARGAWGHSDGFTRGRSGGRASLKRKEK